MNTSTLNWQSFKETLLLHPDLDLQFQYAENKWVDASYHITEIKQASIASVDCGGVLHSWTETIVQLWEPAAKHQERAMKVRKALSIIGIVEKKLQLNHLATVRIEFGNSHFDTRQMYAGEFLLKGENLIVNLIPDVTQCKAINRGESCGPIEKGEECCAPSEATSTANTKHFTIGPSLCEPGSGCC